MEIPKVPKVFFIKGVFKHTAKNLIDVIQDQSNKDIELENETIPQLLKFFTPSQQSNWDSQREVKCATCPKIIKGRQIFIPQNIERVKGEMVYKCIDNARFCKWWCAAHHLQWFLKNEDRYKQLLNQLYKLWEKKLIVEIEPSLPPWRIKDMGGDLTLESYHKICEFNFNRFQSNFDNEDHKSLEQTLS